MRFSVSVPVLSVQMTLVDPSVSTALSRFTSAPLRASSRTATASASVIVGSRPSGTLATIRPMAKLIAFVKERPATRAPSGMKATATTTATRAISQATRRTCSSSGLGSRTTRWESAAIRPSSVCIPVRTTRATASPPVHAVPLKTTFGACSSGTPGSVAVADRSTGSDSPVRVEVSSSTAPSRMRPSAHTRSPSASSRTSPGTRSAAATSRRSPSRRTAARWGRYCVSASTARSVWRSWANAKTALSRITRQIAAHRIHVPVTADSAAAVHSSRASGWTSCSPSSRNGLRRPVARSSLGP